MATRMEKGASRLMGHPEELYTSNMCTKFEANIFIFGCARPQKPSKDDDVTFAKRRFWQIVVCQK